MRRRLATLFVDIAGSTRLVVRHPPETVLGVVQCFAGLVSDVALAHGGQVKDFEGDGVLRYFESVVDAAAAALATTAGVVAALETAAPALARQFRLLDPAFEVPGADGVRVVVYTLDERRRVVT